MRNKILFICILINASVLSNYSNADTDAALLDCVDCTDVNVRNNEYEYSEDKSLVVVKTSKGVTVEGNIVEKQNETGVYLKILMGLFITVVGGLMLKAINPKKKRRK